MGVVIDPEWLTDSGERCVQRLAQLGEQGLPSPQLVTAIATAVEVHVSTMLARLVDLSGLRELKLGDAMLGELEHDMTRSWESRSQWLKSGFGLAYRGRSPYQNFVVLTELRNAIVHGDGAASDQQRRRGIPKMTVLRADLAKLLDVEFYGRSTFGTRTAEKSLDIARAFIKDFDDQILKIHPSARRQ